MRLICIVSVLSSLSRLSLFRFSLSLVPLLSSVLFSRLSILPSLLVTPTAEVT